ncbi:MAG: N-acetylmuramoyl-L-alanine amidase [Lachnospiraceae bacterium]|nr:N-acetylmuramoyl-L-alanine amidase [Lachnospiraceae bacterium]
MERAVGTEPKSMGRVIGLLCMVAVMFILGMNVKAAGQEEIEYVYLDEDVVGISGVQNIVVGFQNEEMVIGGARLLYQTESGTEGTVEAAQILNNTVLFQKQTMEETGTYQITGIVYIDGEGLEQTILFSEKGITVSFQVVQDEALSVSESGAQVETYSMTDDNQLVQAGAETAEEAIAATLEEAGVNEEVAQNARSGERKEVVVAIGAGHDANHPGASANGLREEVLTLKVARYCREELSQYSGVRVVMLRDSESCPYNSSSNYCLNQRVYDAKNAGADLYVDLHFNSGGGTGAEIYYPNKNYRPNLSEEGLSVSNKILEQLSALGLQNRGAKIKDSTLAGSSGQYPDGSKADYFTTNVLAKELEMTGIIVEHAFLDHGSDAAKLQDENFLRQLGVADATGIAQKYGLVKGAGESGYIDVPDGAWYREAVEYVRDQGIMYGMNDTYFGAAEFLERSHFVTMIYRMAGEPKTQFNFKFPDVPDGTFYSLPVTWASDKGIITGYLNGMFGPTNRMTREELATMIYRYAKNKGIDVSEKAELDKFPDYGSVTDFAQEAVSWAVEKGIITGDQGKIQPQKGASRADTATMIMRYVKMYGK